MKSINKITKLFDTILQRDIEIVCERKTIRKGTFILYTIKDYVITLIIKTPTNNKSYDVYYPFNVENIDSCIELDYTIDRLFNKRCTSLLEPPAGASKFLGKKLKIKYS